MPAGDPAGYLPRVKQKRRGALKKFKPGSGKIRPIATVNFPKSPTGGAQGPPPLKGGIRGVPAYAAPAPTQTRGANQGGYRPRKRRPMRPT